MACKALAGIAATALAAMVATSPAGALVVNVGGRTFGITPIAGSSAASRGALRTSTVQPFDKVGAMTYHGGPVMHSARTHVVFWDPAKQFTATTKGIVSGFFENVAADSGKPTNTFATAGQYTDRTGNAAYSTTFAGALTDEAAYPASGCTVPAGMDAGPPYDTCLTDKQLQEGLSAFIGREGLPRGAAQLYFILLPHKVVTCFDATAGECSNNVFCAYHTSIPGTAASEVLYADIPFTLLDESAAKACQSDGHATLQLPNRDQAGTSASTRYADVALKYTAHEFVEATTDPLGTAWYDSTGQENGDKCNATGSEAGADPYAFLPTLGGSAAEGTLYDQAIGSGRYYLQSEWDNAKGACLMQAAPITAAAFSSSTPRAGRPATFKGSASDPYAGIEYSWTFGDGGEGGGAEPTHTYATAGRYTVTMSVRDRLTGATAEKPVSHEVEVLEPLDPSPAFSASTPAVAGQPVHLDAHESEDTNDAIVAYRWKFGDGSQGTGERAEHIYAAPGAYTITLTAEDAAGRTNSISREVAVEPDELPIPSFTWAPTPAVAAQAARFTAAASSDPDGSIVSSTWSFGDGTGASGAYAEHVYASAGEYTVTLTVQDSDGRTASATQTVAVDEPPVPAFSLSPGLASVGESVVAAAEPSADPDGTIVTYAWDWGDGSTTASAAASVAHAYAAPGSYTVRLTVTDSAGRSAATSSSLLVQARAQAMTPLTAAPAAALAAPPPPAPDSAFGPGAAAFDPVSGTITFTEGVLDKGTFSWLATFANGRNGALASRGHCRAGSASLAGACRPPRITFARGSRAGGPGTIELQLRPSRSALRALRVAAAHHRGLLVTVTLSFRSDRGGAAVTHRRTILVRLRRR